MKKHAFFIGILDQLSKRGICDECMLMIIRLDKAEKKRITAELDTHLEELKETIKNS